MRSSLLVRDFTARDEHHRQLLPWRHSQNVGPSTRMSLGWLGMVAYLQRILREHPAYPVGTAAGSWRVNGPRLGHASSSMLLLVVSLVAPLVVPRLAGAVGCRASHELAHVHHRGNSALGRPGLLLQRVHSCSHVGVPRKLHPMSAPAPDRFEVAGPTTGLSAPFLTRAAEPSMPGEV